MVSAVQPHFGVHSQNKEGDVLTHHKNLLFRKTSTSLVSRSALALRFPVRPTDMKITKKESSTKNISIKSQVSHYNPAANRAVQLIQRDPRAGLPGLPDIERMLSIGDPFGGHVNRHKIPEAGHQPSIDRNKRDG